MPNRKDGEGIFSSMQIELTKKHFITCRNDMVTMMLALLRNCNVTCYTKDDCEDMYNEFFTYAVQSYNPSKSRFRYYLKRVVTNKTLTVIRRVIAVRDPLFYSVSLDKNFEDGGRYDSVIGELDENKISFKSYLNSPELDGYNISSLDKTILYYRGLGYTLKEIAGILGLSISSVQRKIEDIRKNKKLLKGLFELD